VHDLQARAKAAVGKDAAMKLCLDWLKELDYEAHLQHVEEASAATRYSNVLDFVEWVARRCGGRGEDDPEQSVLDVAQSISVIMSLMERDEEQDQVTLSTLHASKGLEWPHVVLAGVNEGLLPFTRDEEAITPEGLAEERRLMYVGITRARKSLGVSVLRRRKRGREMVIARPSRFVDEMRLDDVPKPADPRAALAELRARMAAQVAERESKAPKEP
jgi:ATP-dependent DNA helicase Rep